MNKKQTFLIIGALLILLLLALIFKVNYGKKSLPNNNEGQTATTSTDTQITTDLNSSSTPISGDKYKTEVPKNIIIPVVNDKTLTEEQKKIIAVPSIVEPATPGNSSSFRSFDIKAEGGKFTPSQIAGKVGDTMVVNFTAVDRDYSISFPSYNMRQIAKKGETKALGFHAGESGSFTYFCDICGANTIAKGVLIIAK